MLKSKQGRPPKKPKYKEFEKNWNKMTRNELAALYSVAPETISRWAKEFRNDMMKVEKNV